MIGFIGGVARTALSQVARRFGREVADRIMAGENIENILTRDQIRQLGKDLGKAAFNELLRQGKEVHRRLQQEERRLECQNE